MSLNSFVSVFFFFFLMIRRPPRSTLFPYRRSSDLGELPGDVTQVAAVEHGALRPPRSEEHTSELQSQFHLVCRLLLEKKKIKHINNLPIKKKKKKIKNKKNKLIT